MSLCEPTLCDHAPTCSRSEAEHNRFDMLARSEAEPRSTSHVIERKQRRLPGASRERASTRPADRPTRRWVQGRAA